MNVSGTASPKRRTRKMFESILLLLGILSIGEFLGFTAVTLLKRTSSFEDFWIVHSGLIAGLAAALAVLFFGILAAMQPPRTQPTVESH